MQVGSLVWGVATPPADLKTGRSQNRWTPQQEHAATRARRITNVPHHERDASSGPKILAKWSNSASAGTDYRQRNIIQIVLSVFVAEMNSLCESRPDFAVPRGAWMRCDTGSRSRFIGDKLPRSGNFRSDPFLGQENLPAANAVITFQVMPSG